MLNCHADTIHLFSAKGGQGCTVATALLAADLATCTLHHTIYDVAPRCDLAAALDAPVDDTGRFAIWADHTTGYRLDNLDAGADLPVADLIDWGTTPIPDDTLGHRYLVTAPCYLALRAATTPNPVRLDGIIVITEPRRALGSRDVAATLNAPVIAEVPRDATISRAVDAGLLRSRYPQAAAPILPVLTDHLRVSGRPDPRL